MKFSEVLAQTIAWLQREERISYRALKREFALDDETLEDLKAELIEVKQLASDKDGKMLVWVGKGINGETAKRINGDSEGETAKGGNGERGEDAGPRTSDVGRSAAERRQLTVLFCDLVGSTALSTQLDPEDLRAVVQYYQQTCAEVIQRHDGHIAQYLGDGLLVYFGYPVAHEDDARRAVRVGLEIINALRQEATSPSLESGEEILPSPPLPKEGTQKPPLTKGAALSAGGLSGEEEWRQLQVRIGIHSGLVVIGDIGTSDRTEQLALGETPNIAARIQGLAEPNTVMISAATQRLIDGQFDSQPFGSHVLKGIDTPIAVYQVQSERQSASPLAGKTTLTPLIGREQEVGLLIDRWEQAKEGRGQVVLLSENGKPGVLRCVALVARVSGPGAQEGRRSSTVFPWIISPIQLGRSFDIQWLGSSLPSRGRGNSEATDRSFGSKSRSRLSRFVSAQYGLSGGHLDSSATDRSRDEENPRSALQYGGYRVTIDAINLSHVPSRRPSGAEANLKGIIGRYSRLEISGTEWRTLLRAGAVSPQRRTHAAKRG
jgi:class 3 adenylate cyclase